MVGIWKVQNIIGKKIEDLSGGAGMSPEQVKKSVASIDSCHPPQQVLERVWLKGVSLVYGGP